MQTLSIKKGSLVHRVQLPSSKSYANRALIFAAIAGGNKTIRNLPQASDVTILIDCLKTIGLEFTLSQGTISLKNSFPDCEQGPKTIEVGEGGTTARFLACMLLLGKEEYKLILGERLKERPWQEFLTLVSHLNAKATLTGNVLTIQGPAQFPSEVTVDCSQTTQFATGLKLLTRKAKFHVLTSNLDSSQSYWAMTERLMDDMSNASTYAVPLDWSSASYPLAFAALNQSVFFPDLQNDPFQADAKFLEILRTLNCIEERDDGICVHRNEVKRSFDFDVSDCLDLVPTLGYFLAHVPGTHHLRNVQNLVFKESDRLTQVIELVKKFDRKISTDGKTLTIEGSDGIVTSPIDLQFPNDHRMVMVGTLFLLHHSGGTVSPAEAVNKSYPEFFQLIAP